MAKEQYFTEDTENAILEYVACTDEIKRNKIWNERIEYAMHKLTENLIHTFKFYYLDVNSIQELQHEVTTFVLTKLDKYQKGKGKAFSYFGTIAKRWLIVYNDKNYKKLVSKAKVDEIDDDKTITKDIINKLESDSSDFLELYISYIDKNLNKLFPIEKEALIANAIMELFRKRESLEIFNKKALYIYIREITNISTPQITKIIKHLKTIYISKFNEYYRDGHIKI